MNCIVGVWDGEIALRQLMENRMGPGALGRIGLREGSFPGSVGVELENKETLFSFCDVLADILMENLQTRYIMQRLEKNGMLLDEKEKCEILIATLKKLWYGDSGTQWLEHLKKDVSNRIAVCLLENDTGFLLLDGVIRFRMKDQTQKWMETLDRCVEEYMTESEKQEFVRLLRYFVSMRDPSLSWVRLQGRGRDYRLFDPEDRELPVRIPGTEVSAEDMLLSRLINLSPERIIIEDPKDFADTEFVELLCKVFVGRVVVWE